jgi:hypothetical protein
VTLDPQIAPLIDMLDAGYPPVHTMSGAEARALIRSRFVPPSKLQHVAEVRDDVVEGPGARIPVRVYRPDSRDTSVPILLYAHGGGFVFCDLDSHDALCRDIANDVPAVVIRRCRSRSWPRCGNFCPIYGCGISTDRRKWHRWPPHSGPISRGAHAGSAGRAVANVETTILDEDNIPVATGWSVKSRTVAHI